MAVIVGGFIGGVFCYPSEGVVVSPMKPHRSYPGKAAFVIANPKSPLMDQIRQVLRVKHYSLRTEEAYTGWVLRFLKFHRDPSGRWKHPRDLGSSEVVGFLKHLASVQAVSLLKQSFQCILDLAGALLFELFESLLGKDGEALPDGAVNQRG